MLCDDVRAYCIAMLCCNAMVCDGMLYHAPYVVYMFTYAQNDCLQLYFDIHVRIKIEVSVTIGRDVPV